MPVMDEFREEREAIKHGTFKQKYQYFKDYYRMPLLITILAILFVGTLVYKFVTSKDYAFYAAMLNCVPYEEYEWLNEEFADHAKIDLDRYRVVFDYNFFYTCNSSDENSVYTTQKLDAYTAARQLDVMLGTGDEFAHFADSMLFMDLRTVLTEEQLQKYEPYLYYIDVARVNQEDAEISDPQDYANPRKPKEMEDPVPVAIYVDSCKKLETACFFRNADNGIALGIYVNSLHVDNAVALIEYLLSD